MSKRQFAGRPIRRGEARGKSRFDNQAGFRGLEGPYSLHQLRCGFKGPEQAAEKGRNSGEKLEKHTSGAEARVLFYWFYAGDKSPAYRPNGFFRSMQSLCRFMGFLPGMNPRPTARMSFSAACKGAFIARLDSGAFDPRGGPRPCSLRQTVAPQHRWLLGAH